MTPIRNWSPRTTSFVARVLTACALANLAVAIWDIAAGGFYFQILGMRISSWEAYKPLRNGLVCAASAAWLHDRNADSPSTTWAWLERASRGLTVAFVLAWTAVAIRYTTRAVGGSDTYGYVSEAALWASGHLVVHDRLAELAPLLGRCVAPLGYQLALVPGAIVPTYSPGLPLVMALALKITGQASSVYYIVPLAGAVAIWLTYVLAARFGGSRAGLFAAVGAGLSPIFIFQSLHPMSDVPATMWWLAAWTLAWPAGRKLPIAAGLATSMAILTRPNLAPLALIIGALVLLERPRGFRAAAFSAAVVPGCAAVALVNAHLYGSPLTSGYGSLHDLYTWHNFVENFRNYASWFVNLHSAAPLAGIAAPMLVRSRRAWLMLAFAAGVLFSYLFYFVYDGWIYLRFLLPAIPLVFVLSSLVLMWLVGHLPPSLKGSAAMLIVALSFWSEVRAQPFDVFTAGPGEQRFVVVGEYLGRALPANAVVLALDESGSVRMYGHRETVRWDLVEDGRLDYTLETLRTHGYVPYILLEPWEQTWFKEKFAASSVYGRIDWPPAIEVRGPIAARVYSVDDRIRYITGDEIHPTLLTIR
jgi:Dolichyl-phosphate-mannose-protein mannosyltransferase